MIQDLCGTLQEAHVLLQEMFKRWAEPGDGTLRVYVNSSHFALGP